MNFKILQENFKIQKLTGDFSREFQNSKFQKLRENLNFKSCSAPEGPAAPVPGLSSGAQAQLRIQLSKSQDSTLKISGFNSQNLGSSVPGLSGAQLSKSQLQGVLQEISPENFEIQNLRENFKVLQDFEIQKLLENSPENFEIQNPAGGFQNSKAAREFSRGFQIQNLTGDFSRGFQIQKLQENSPEDFKIQKLRENSPENFEISKAAREFQNLLQLKTQLSKTSRLNSQKLQDSTLKNSGKEEKS